MTDYNKYDDSCVDFCSYSVFISECFWKSSSNTSCPWAILKVIFKPVYFRYNNLLFYLLQNFLSVHTPIRSYRSMWARKEGRWDRLFQTHRSVLIYFFCGCHFHQCCVIAFWLIVINFVNFMIIYCGIQRSHEVSHHMPKQTTKTKRDGENFSIQFVFNFMIFAS